MVFTEQYLRDRGYCCTSGCRHCPFGFERFDPGKVPDDERPKKPGEASSAIGAKGVHPGEHGAP